MSNIGQNLTTYLSAGIKDRYFYGLRRNNFSSQTRKDIKKAYQLIYNSSLNISQAVEEINDNFKNNSKINEILDFIEKSNRGLI